MSKKLKRVLAVIVCATLVAAVFAACDSGKTTTENDVTTTAAPDASKGTLVIGGTGPLTGDYAQYGLGVKLSAELAVEEINAAGGINGIQLKFIMEDDQAMDTITQTAYGTLRDNGMMVGLGSVTSGSCTAYKAEAEQDGLFYITPSATSMAAISDYDKAFRVCFSDPAQGTVSAQYIAESLTDVKSVATIYDSSNDYSKGIHDNFIQAIADNGYGFEVVVDEAFTSDSKTDFSVQLQKVKDSGADLLFLPIYYQEASAIMTQADSLGISDIIIFGCDGLDGIIAQLGDRVALAEGVMLLTPFSENDTDPATQAFVQAYRAKYGEDDTNLNQFGADAYDGIYAIKAAVEKAGITEIGEDVDIAALGDQLRDAFLSMTIDGVTGKNITWSAEGEPSKSPKAVKIENGAYVAA